MTTLAPSLAACGAHALPIPELLPVTKTTLFSRFFYCEYFLDWTAVTEWITLFRRDKSDRR